MAKRKGKGINVDLSKVEAGGSTLPEGRYTVEVASASVEQSQSGNDYIKLELTVTEGSKKGSKLFHNCSLQPQALFNLKQVLLALGFDIPGKAFDLDLDEIIGLECEVEVSHELYEGKKKARITEFVNPGDTDSDEDDEDDEDSSDFDAEEAVEELELEDLKRLAKELGLKVGKKDKASTIAENILEEDEDDIKEAMDDLGLLDSEEEEEEDETDYSEMTLAELKAEAKERGIKVKKGMDKDDIIELLEEDDEE